MYSGKRFLLSCLFLIFLGVLCLFITPLSHSASTITVEPELQATLNSDGQAGYIIFFREKPNLSQAYTMGWKSRGEFVMNSLQSAATIAQVGVQEYLKQHNVSYKAFWIDNIIVVESSSKAVFDGLLNFPEIESIKARRTMQLHEPIKDEGTKAAPMAVGPNIAHVQADDVWGLGFTGTGIVVANIDTGVRYTHQALVGQYRGNLGGGSYNHNYNWWDPSNACGSPSNAPCDNNGHGSHTMGTIIGDDASHTNQIGMAPGARWIACKGCESNSCSDFALLGCAQFIIAPTNLAGADPNPSLRPHVVNNSWGGSGGQDWYQTSVDNWHAAGIYPVFSAGNSGPGCGTAGSPGDYGNVTAVGAINHSDNLPASFSSRGPGAFDDDVNGAPGLLRLKPQVSAPGVNICSSFYDSDTSYNCGYSGTSMAAPHVAGLVALMWNAAPCIARNYTLTETIIQNTATGLTTTETCGGLSGIPNNTTGYGLINALVAVQTAIAHCGPSGTLQGTVIDTLTSNPIEDALVSAGGRTELTNASGQYTFSFMSVGTYDVTVDVYGYQPMTANRVAIADGVTTTQDFAFSAGRLEVDVPFIDVAIPANTIASRTFNITNTGLYSAGFEIKEGARTVLSVISIPPNETKVLHNAEPSSVGRAPRLPLADNQSSTQTNFVLAGSKAYAIDLSQYQLGSFDTDTPGIWSMIGGVVSDYFFAGDFLGDDFTKLYVIADSTNQFATIDIDSAAITPIGTSTPNPSESWTGLTSTQDGALYGSATSCSSSTLYAINPSNGIVTPIGSITNAPCIIDIAINSQGEMYGIDIVNDNLIKIDPATGAGMIIGSIGFDANYAQGMSFDRSTDVLYLAAYNTSEGGQLRIADTTTGNTVLVGAFPNSGEVDCLAFPSVGSIGWFSESPITGTIAASFSTPVDVTIDSTGKTPGTYGASLNIENDTPYGSIRIPVTMLVVPASAKQYNLTAKKKQVNSGDGIIQSSDSVINCGGVCKMKYYQGPRVLLTATAYPGSTFTGWLPTSLNCPGTGPCTVAMNKSKKAQAVFVGDYSVTVQKKGNGTGRVASQDGGIDCGSTCTVKHPVHTTVTLTAAPDRGMKFVKWSPSKLCPGTGSCQVTLDKAKKVTAYFDIQ